MNNLSISDSLSEIQPELEIEQKMNLSKRKIKKMVMNQLSNKKSSQRKIKHFVVLPIAIIMFIFSVSAIAATFSEGFQMFLSDNLFFLNSQNINLSDVDSGIIMTVKSAVNDGKSGMVLVEFTKEDKLEFPKDVDLSDLRLSSSSGSFEYSKQIVFSDDGKVMYCLLSVLSTEHLSNQELLLSLNDLKTEVDLEQKQSAIDLLSLYNSQPISDNVHDVPSINIQNFNIEMTEDIFLEGIVYSDGDLYLYYDRSISNKQSHISCLINKTTGEKIYADESYNYESPISNEKERLCMIFKSKELDLSAFNIMMEVFHGTNLAGDWNIKFKLQKEENSAEKKVSVVVNTGDYTAAISKMNLSMLGLQLEGVLSDESGNVVKESFSLDITIILNNGQIVKPIGNSLQYKSDTFLFNSIFVEPVHISDVQTIIINNTDITI